MTPKKQEKHFLVSEIAFDEEGNVTSCCIEAILSKRTIAIDWHELKDASSWLHGWK